MQPFRLCCHAMCMSMCQLDYGKTFHSSYIDLCWEFEAENVLECHVCVTDGLYKQGVSNKTVQLYSKTKLMSWMFYLSDIHH